MVNQNRKSNSEGSKRCLESESVVFEGMQRSTPGYSDDMDLVSAEIATLLSIRDRQTTQYPGDVFSTAYFPIFNDFSSTRYVTGVMRVIIHWASYFDYILPDSKRGLIVILENGCDSPFTYQIDGDGVKPLGDGDLHQHAYNKYERTASYAGMNTISDGTATGLRVELSQCPYAIRVYPSSLFHDEFTSNTPLVVTCAAGIVFLFTIFMFFVYDRLVEKRQSLLMRKTVQTHKIVSSLFPKNIRDRLLEENDDNKKGASLLAPHQRLKTFLNGKDDNNENSVIADLFPHTTVLFADICGFTAWSSTREPAQVFILLQTVYQAFDQIATRRKVFKVETIGDSVSNFRHSDCNVTRCIILTLFGQLFYR